MEKMPNFNDVFLSIMASFIGFGLVIGIAQAAFDFGGGRSLLLSSPVFAESSDPISSSTLNSGVQSCPADMVLVESPNYAPGTGYCVKRERPIATTTISSGSTTTINKKLLDPACMIAAVGSRDSAIVTALNSYNQSIGAAIATRTASLISAWQITNRIERKKAIRNVWTSFRGAANKATKILNEAKKDSWQKYNIDRKACGAYGAVDDPTSRYADAML